MGDVSGILFRAIQIAGVAGILISLLQIDWLAFTGIRQVIRYFNATGNIDKTEVLVTTGLYRYTRHPLYFFSLLVIWFVPVMTVSWLYLTIGATCYFMIGSYFEEKKMIRQYGGVYTKYKEEVPWLIPFLKKV